MKMKTKEEYLKRFDRCPFCDSDKINAGEVTFDLGFVEQKIDCLDCGAYWRDIYKLDNYNANDYLNSLCHLSEAKNSSIIQALDGAHYVEFEPINKEWFVWNGKYTITRYTFNGLMIDEDFIYPGKSSVTLAEASEGIRYWISQITTGK